MWSTIKATRIERSLYAIGIIIAISAIINSFSLDIFILIVNSILLYAVGGLINAKKDNDCGMGKKNINAQLVVLFLLSFTLSLRNTYLFIATLLWFFFGFFYNYYSRRVIMMDCFVLSITHVIIPGVFTFLILGANEYSILIFILFLSLVFFALIAMKNINQKVEDTKRGYSTLMTRINKGFEVTIVLYFIAILLMILTPFLFGFEDLNYLAPSTLSLSCVPFFVLIWSGDFNLPVQIMRVTWFIYLFIITFMHSSNQYFLMSSFGVLFIHFFLINRSIFQRLAV